MSLDPPWLDEVLRRRMPRASANARLELIPWRGTPGYPPDATGLSPVGLWACLRLTRGGATNGSTGICLMALPKQLDVPAPRAEAYLEGWLSAVDHFLEHAAPQVLSLATPQNLVCPAALDLARPKTADDFRAAILAPRRLGKLLGDPVAAMRSLDSGRA